MRRCAGGKRDGPWQRGLHGLFKFIVKLVTYASPKLVTYASPKLGRFNFDQHHKWVPPPTLTTALVQGQFRWRSFPNSR